MTNSDPDRDCGRSVYLCRQMLRLSDGIRAPRQAAHARDIVFTTIGGGSSGGGGCRPPSAGAASPATAASAAPAPGGASAVPVVHGGSGTALTADCQRPGGSGGLVSVSVLRVGCSSVAPQTSPVGPLALGAASCGQRVVLVWLHSPAHARWGCGGPVVCCVALWRGGRGLWALVSRYEGSGTGLLSPNGVITQGCFVVSCISLWRDGLGPSQRVLRSS